MTVETKPESARPARARAPRSEGQWALGERDPLNHNEEFKREDNPLNVRQRIVEVYSKQGFESIHPDDLRGRFRWMGLYTQRKPGIDGGRTAQLEPEELDDTHFMMRIRIDGGILSTEQLQAIGEVSTQYAQDTADITDRQNIQYHWIDIENVPAIWDRLEPLGLWTQEACGDCPRVILGSPLAGRLDSELVNPLSAIEAIKQILREDDSLANLPRKYKSSVSWFWDAVPEINDVSFVGVEHPEHGPGFDVFVGGGLSTSAHLAPRLGAWVPLEEVPEVWRAVTEFFRDYGYRRLRNKARMKYLVKDWGAEKVREVIEKEYLKRPFIDGPSAVAPESPIDYVGITQQKDGKVAVGFAAVAGRVSGTILTKVAEAARAAGSDAVSFTPLQKLVVLDVDPDKADELIDTLRPLGLHARASLWRRGTMACTGLEYCKLAIVDTKQRAHDLVADLDERLADVKLDRPIAINLNGCPNSCARIQVADIGLKGQIVTDDAGEQVEGFQAHLGGELGADAGYGRKLRGHKVVSAELGDYVERLVRAYAADAQPGERFAQWAGRAEEDVLQ
ncbi:MAG: nitrite/sulfite reductase [Dermatophilus congolensis]|nr:nitrite/sulfite reductase [Dermatophilus congolensis]